MIEYKIKLIKYNKKLDIIINSNYKIRQKYQKSVDFGILEKKFSQILNSCRISFAYEKNFNNFFADFYGWLCKKLKSES